jgi:tetratricopeptide (TPR) repeat protein
MIRAHRPTARPVLVAVIALSTAVAAAAAVGACADDERPRTGATASPSCPPCACPQAAVVDRVLLAFLSKARASHHEADLAEAAGHPAEAIAVLDRLVQGRVPGGSSPPPEVREVLADTYARLAELRSARGLFDEALADIERGLRLAVERTHFRGRLMEVRGVVEERRAAALEAAGDKPGARAARARAVDAFEQAIEIQAFVIERALGDGGLLDGDAGALLPPLPDAAAEAPAASASAAPDAAEGP